MLLSLNQKKIFFGCYGHFKIVQYLNIEFWYLSAPHPTFLQYRHKAMEGLFRLVISRGVKLGENRTPRVLKMHGHPHLIRYLRVSATGPYKARAKQNTHSVQSVCGLIISLVVLS